ncbi:MAG TPA: propionate catabolism operon regulatory protein PrpR [Anaeromyxobacteraceae bacterium]|nr:propionate catabolism operon regulatory protein PrpR [Anaeromyxobacteraceae bacterium]
MNGARRPTIWAFSRSRLRQVFEAVAPLHATAAVIRVFPASFEEALTTCRELARQGERADVLVAAGANAAYLGDHADAPVILVRATALDVIQALIHARGLSRRVGVVNYRGSLRGLDRAGELLRDIEVEMRAYVSPEEARASVYDLAARGVEVVIGPGPVCEFAEQAGLKSFLLYDTDSVSNTFERAIEVARVVQAEEDRRERLRSILAHVDAGLVAVDLAERVESVNPAAERLLGLLPAETLGRSLAEVSQPLSLSSVLQSGQPERDEILSVGKRTLAVNRVPLRQHGVVTGALLTCQDASTIQRLDRGLRTEHRPRRFVARYELDAIAGRSAAIGRVRELARQYARTDATVLITGESGTGKELFAQGVHNASGRRDRPFVAINCAAFPETLLESELFGYEEGAFTGSRRGGRAGLFEAAHTGTIFLDEVGDVSLTLQTRLLRVLQERQVLRLGANDPTPVDVRVIAATNRDLRAAVDDGEFRRDLFYRLEILPLHLPPIRERREDVGPIASELLRRALLRHRRPEALGDALALLGPHLERHDWPGNVREMENVLERVAVLFAGRPVGAAVGLAALAEVLPELFAGPASPDAAAARPAGLRATRRAQERAHILRVVEECGGNHTAAAKRLGIGRSTLWRKLGSEGEQ